MLSLRGGSSIFVLGKPCLLHYHGRYATSKAKASKKLEDIRSPIRLRTASLSLEKTTYSNSLYLIQTLSHNRRIGK